MSLLSVSQSPLTSPSGPRHRQGVPRRATVWQLAKPVGGGFGAVMAAASRPERRTDGGPGCPDGGTLGLVGREAGFAIPLPLVALSGPGHAPEIVAIQGRPRSRFAKAGSQAKTAVHRRQILGLILHHLEPRTDVRALLGAELC